MEISYSEVDEFENKKPNMKNVETFSMEDSNVQEKLVLKESIKNCKTLRILMRKFYDLYGRVIIYDMKVKGSKTN